MRDTFSDCHPAVNFAYFALVLAFSMTLMHPVCLLISLTGACCYLARLHGLRELGHSARWLVPMALLAALVNPAFVHQGVTILTYLPSGNPLTLEAIYYGIAAASMMVTVITWFSCCNVVMTSDKFVYLFGKLIPALSLILSMTLRFVPRFTAQIKVVTQAQRCVGRDVSSGSVRKRIHNGLTILSIVITWALENAIETADSMKSRGYGLKGRTAFSIFRMEERDRYALLWLGFCGVYLTCGAIAGGLKWWYFPALTGTLAQPMTVSFYLVYLALCLTPVILDRREARAWRCSPSRT